MQFKDPRLVEILTLPSFKGSEVEMYDGLTVGDQRSILNEKKSDESMIGMSMVINSIKSWNFTEDEEGKTPLAVTIENLEKFPIKDLMFLIKYVTEKNAEKEDVKKK